MVMYMHWSSFCIVYSVLFCFVSLYKNVLVLIVVNECLNMFLFLGFCTEFNVAGGVIQSHPLAPCNKMTFPKCNIPYSSSEAYKCKIPYLLFLIIYLTLGSRFFSHCLHVKITLVMSTCHRYLLVVVRRQLTFQHFKLLLWNWANIDLIIF